VLRKLYFSFRYLGNPTWDTGVPPPEVVQFADHHDPGSALDVGCGTGATSVFLAERGWSVLGVDFVPLAIWKANRRARPLSGQPVFQVGQVPELRNVTGTFDLVVDVGCFHSLSPSERARYADRIRSLLRPGGDLLLYAFTRPSRPGAPVQEVRLLFSAGFTEQNLQIDPDGRAAWYTYQRR